MKVRLLVFLLSFSTLALAQHDDRITTVEFIQVLNGNKVEAEYYYQNNWKVLREMALKKEYIHSYQLLETPASEEAPYHYMLITTYASKSQYDLREEHFGELIKEKGELKLLNDKKPGEFRKSLYSKEMVRHLK